MSIDYGIYPPALTDPELQERTAGPGRSALERLLDDLQMHEQAERELLDEYSNAAATLPDRGVRFIMGLILEDESRHQRLMAAMAKDLRSSIEWLENDVLPTIDGAEEDKTDLLANTDRFLQIERETAEELKELRKSVKHLNGGMLEVLVGGMEADTNKHIDMLKYVRKQLERE